MPVTNYDQFGGMLLGEHASGTQTDYLTDALGSITATVNQSATVLNTYRYKPNAAILARTGAAADPVFLWNGGTQSRRAGSSYDLNYNYFRHFDGVPMIWNSVDPLWPHEAPYSYANANPTSVIDKFGYQAVKKKPAKKLPWDPKPEPSRPKKDPRWPFPFPDPGHWGSKPPPWKPIGPPSKLPWIPASGIGTGYSYGAYCGSDNVRNPGLQVEPQDAIDACCQIHDRCLEAHYGAGFVEKGAHHCCDQALADCATWALLDGCYDSPRPMECVTAAVQITIAFYHLARHYKCDVTCLEQSQWQEYIYEHWSNDPWRLRPQKK